jgi:hypothetical protein
MMIAHLTPAINLMLNGLQLVVRDQNGTTIFERDIPPGAGWKANSAGTHFRFKTDSTTLVGGITKAMGGSQRAGHYKVKVIGKDGDFQVTLGEPPVGVEVVPAALHNKPPNSAARSTSPPRTARSIQSARPSAAGNKDRSQRARGDYRRAPPFRGIRADSRGHAPPLNTRNCEPHECNLPSAPRLYSAKRTHVSDSLSAGRPRPLGGFSMKMWKMLPVFTPAAGALCCNLPWQPRTAWVPAATTSNGCAAKIATAAPDCRVQRAQQRSLTCMPAHVAAKTARIEQFQQACSADVEKVFKRRPRSEDVLVPARPRIGSSQPCKDELAALREQHHGKCHHGDKHRTPIRPSRDRTRCHEARGHDDTRTTRVFARPVEVN